MKISLSVSLVFLLNPILFAQKEVKDQDIILFEKGNALNEFVNNRLELKKLIGTSNSDSLQSAIETDILNSVLNNAQEYYQELISNYPNSKLILQTLTNEGFIQLALNNKEQAKQTFKKVLESKLIDKGGAPSALTTEPFTNNKNSAVKALANIEISEGNFNQAIFYLNQTKKYPYQHFCENAYAAEEIYMATKYAECYIGLKNVDKALEYLLPNIFYNGFANNSQLVKLTYETLIKKYSKAELKSDFEKSFQNRGFEKGKTWRENEYFMELLKIKIKIPSFDFDYLSDDGKRNSEMEKVFKESEFYKLLCS